MMHGGWPVGAWGAWGWFGMAVMALFWIGVLALLFWGVLAVSRGDRVGRGLSPREILDRRLAHGEIDEAAYDRLREKVR